MDLRRLAAAAALVALVACAGKSTSFKSLYITGPEIRDSGVESAYDVLANHREIIIVGDEIAFRGGANFDGETERYSTPLLVVDGDRDLGDPTTVLRQIKAEDIALIRLIYASQVGPRDRRPQAAGGIIEITTQSTVGSRL